MFFFFRKAWKGIFLLGLQGMVEGKIWTQDHLDYSLKHIPLDQSEAHTTWSGVTHLQQTHFFTALLP